MNLTVNEISRLKDRWSRACFNKNSGEHQQACVSREVWKACGGNETLAYELLGRIGVVGSTKAKCKSMVLVLKEVPDEDVWVAIGWAAVRRVAAAGKRERTKKIKEIRKAAKGGKLPMARVTQIVPLAPKGAPAPTPTGPTGVPSAKRQLGVLIAEIKRLVSNGYLSEAALSTDALSVVGLKKNGRRKAS